MYDDTPSTSSMMEGISALHQIRLDQVLRCLRASGASRVLDLGCGSGHLLHRLAIEKQFKSVVGLEACPRALAKARRLLADHPQGPFPQLTLINSSYTEHQPSLCGYDAAAMVETIEHVKPNRLSAVEQVVFKQMRPRMIYLTTPNREYNPLLGLHSGELREADHKFEWDRHKFNQWANGIARRNGYRVTLGGIGDNDPRVGPPTQTAYFALIER